MDKIFRLRPSLILILVFSCPALCFAQSQDKIFSVFLVSFVKYITWPDNSEKGEFVIGVIGSKEIASELNKAVATKKAGNLAIKIVEFSTSESSYSCNLLFLSESATSSVDDIIKKIAPHTVMVVGKDGYAKKTGGIDLYLQGDKVKFNINKTGLEKKEMKISSQLLSLGNII